MIEDLIKERSKKRDNLIAAGYDPYPSRIERNYLIGNAVRRFFFLSILKKTVSVAGRIMGMRAQGGVMFLDLKDASGRIQAVLNKKQVKDYAILKENLDIGDFVAVKGTLFKTKKGEKSVKVISAAVAVKSLRPLPSEWYGLKDAEERYRKRYLDLLLNSEEKNRIESRFKLMSHLRKILETDGFLEVETPILQAIPGGATARPFTTHHNALDVDFYLRIAPELYLKRILAGGFEKVFEMGRNFRNEGMDRDHNPEFTSLELYWAYQDYKGLMKSLKKWMHNLVDMMGIEAINYSGQTVNLRDKWETVSFEELFKKYSGKDFRDVPAEDLDEIFKKEVRPNIIRPTYVIDYPESIMPLAKLKKEDPMLTESFQLIINGAEIVKAFSEMNDPIIQREQMERQEKEFRKGNEEASRLDEDFLETLEYGMPPAAGLGIGIDRLAALLTNTHSIKDIIVFPTLRPKKRE
jgi:lysyl-tRNA synthetase, class II